MGILACSGQMVPACPLDALAFQPGARLRTALSAWLHLDDPWVVDVVLATVVANMAGGDPLWLLLVNPPSTGKTELVQLFRHLPECGWLPEVTENTFLSGLQRSSPTGPTVPARDASLLFRWTDPMLRGGRPPVRVMLVQDLTSLITQRRERRDIVFGQLRQIYDGRFAKSTGMGDDLLWEGYLGLLGAVTPHYDEVAELNSTLGERFLLFRPSRLDPLAEATRATQPGAAAKDWCTLVAKVATKAFANAVKSLSGVVLPPAAQDGVAHLASLTARGRTPVSRDSYSRVLRSVPEPEGPARLAQQQRKLLIGLCAARSCSVPGSPELEVLAKVARDSIPALRFLVLSALTVGPLDLAGVVAVVQKPRTTVRYQLEDLQAIGLVRQASSQWSLEPGFLETALSTGFLR